MNFASNILSFQLIVVNCRLISQSDFLLRDRGSSWERGIANGKKPLCFSLEKEAKLSIQDKFAGCRTSQ